MTSIIIFILILGILIVVHEFGHFIVAKKAGIRVDEFGIGYPPRAAKLFTWGETVFTLNWIPFGGFVKIFGENPDDESISGPESSRSFVHKSKIKQAAVIVAGVFFNVVFAWLLISAGFMVGLPTSVENSDNPSLVQNTHLVITSVAKDSPASEAGLKTGDTILALSAGAAGTGAAGATKKESPESLNPEVVASFIGSHGNSPINISYTRGSEAGDLEIVPRDGIAPGKKAIGISMDTIGTLKLPIHKALWEGAKTTVILTEATAIGLGTFLYDAVRGHSDLSQVTGPVGIVGLVGDASKLGFIYILSFTAFISINLAVINLIPFPALDGGRLLMIIIEAIKKSPINPKVANTINAVGFVLLILLMVVVTIHDIVKLF